MFANVSRVRLQPGKMEEGPTFWQQTILPVLKQLQGFRGLIVLGDPQSNKGMALLLWESEADGEAALNSRALQQAFEPGMAMLAGQPELEGYQVGLIEMA